MAWSRFPRWRDIWRWMSADERTEACECFWASVDRESSEWSNAVRHLADSMNLRPKTAKALPAKKAGVYLARGRTPSGSTINSVLTHFHLDCRSELVQRFVDSLQIPNECGLIDPEAHEMEPRSEEQLEDAVAAIRNSAPPRQADLLLAVECLQGVQPLEGLGAVLDRLDEQASVDPPMAEDARDLREEERTPADADAPIVLRGGFTTLDKLVIDAAVATVGEADGALEVEALDDLIEETVQLNSKRHRSHFHRGFVDGLLDREFRTDGPELNDARRRWYVCGLVMGFERRAERAKIAELLGAYRNDLTAICRDQHPSSAMTTRLIYQAVRDHDDILTAAALLNAEGIRAGRVELVRGG